MRNSQLIFQLVWFCWARYVIRRVQLFFISLYRKSSCRSSFDARERDLYIFFHNAWVTRKEMALPFKRIRLHDVFTYQLDVFPFQDYCYSAYVREKNLICLWNDVLEARRGFEKNKVYIFSKLWLAFNSINLLWSMSFWIVLTLPSAPGSPWSIFWLQK